MLESEANEIWTKLQFFCRYCGDSMKKNQTYCSSDCQKKDSVWCGSEE